MSSSNTNAEEEFKQRLEELVPERPRWAKHRQLTQEYAEQHPGLVADYLRLAYRFHFEGKPGHSLEKCAELLKVDKDTLQEIDTAFHTTIQPLWRESEEFKQAGPPKCGGK